MNSIKLLNDYFNHIDRLEICGMKCDFSSVEIVMVYKGNSKYHFSLLMIQEVLRHVNDEGDERFHLSDLTVVPMDVRTPRSYINYWVTPDLLLKVELVKEPDEVPLFNDGNKQTKKQKVLVKNNGHCAYCGTPLTEDTMTIDHIVPKKQGGTKALSNCYAACQRCNSLKSNKSLKQFRPLLAKEMGGKQDFQFYFERI